MGRSIAVSITLFIWRARLKKLFLILLSLGLTACVTVVVPPEPVVEEPPQVPWVAPPLFLNHPDRPSMPLAAGLDEVGVCYQIFVASFADSNQDGIGDLNGITAKLDHLANLNVQCLWLTPIHPSPSYHKYDVLDYYSIDPEFGTLEDFDRLIEEASIRGISVLMDLVVNHTSKQHPWFTQRPDFYRIISENHPDYNMRYWHRMGNGLMYYAYFWDQMPELNLDHPEVREETFNMARFWLERGVGGFRLDAVRHFFDVTEYPIRTNTLQANIRYLKEFNEVVKSVNPNAIVIAEVWSPAADVARYLPGVDSAFNFDVAEAIVRTVASGSDDSSTNLIGTWQRVQALYNAQETAFHDSIFLTNHDQDRVMSLLGDNEAKAELAASIVFTLPGMSWIYYGEELGMRGARSASATDAERRQPFPWQDRYQVAQVDGYRMEVANQSLQVGNQMHQHYQQLTRLKADPVIRLGTLNPVQKTQRHFLAYTLSYDNTVYLVVHNLSAQAQLLMVDVPVIVKTQIRDGLESENPLLIAPYSSVIFEVDTTDITLLFEE